MIKVSTTIPLVKMILIADNSCFWVMLKNNLQFQICCSDGQYSLGVVDDDDDDDDDDDNDDVDDDNDDVDGDDDGDYDVDHNE